MSTPTPIDVTTRDFDAIVDTVGPVAAAEIAEWASRFDCCDVRVEVTPIVGGGVDVCANHRPGCPRERS